MIKALAESVFATLVAGMLLSGTAAHANLIVNGSFEADSQTANT
jgi:hypothetical protein